MTRYAIPCLFAAGMATLSAIPAWPHAADVSWNEFAKDSQDSMPIGNGDIGLNVWTESDGDVLFYIGKTDSWTEQTNSGLGKVGRVRISLSPNPFVAENFSQTLKLHESEILIRGKGTTLRLWVDANAPVIRIETTSDGPLTTTVTLDPWRTEQKDKVTPDVVVPAESDRITWYHRNSGKINPELLDRTFGGTIRGEQFIRAAGNSIRSATPENKSRVSIHILSTPGGSIEEWKEKLDRQATSAGQVDPHEAREAHRQWWADFWNRSHVIVTGGEDAARVTRGYILQRFITACAGRGAYPIKFNGSIFVTDNPGNTRREKGSNADLPDPMNADERGWGGQYWFQNTRPMYWPRLAAGDTDFMKPLFGMYRAILDGNARQVKEFYDHEGAYFRETAPFWGGLKKLLPDDKAGYTEHYYLPILELSAMMLDYFDHTGDVDYMRDQLLPAISAGVTFYDQHFPRGPDGKLLLEPVNSIEMFWKTRNPAPDIAALRYLLPRLMTLPDTLATAASRAQWTRLLGELPPLPMGERDGRRILLPYEGEQNIEAKNTEVPEMYAVYPFRLYGVGKPDLKLALDTFAARSIKRTGCWHQDPVWAAFLGLADEAKRHVVSNLTNREPRLRFPGFWEKGHDYAPDQDNGGNGEHALQLMLMQCDGNKIILLPAWPKEWNADFKLHAPGKTIVEGHAENGRVTNLKVTPHHRRADVVLPGL